jgi:hypothetical protein
MAFYNTCEYCKAALDPGEKCDCRKARMERKEHEKANKTNIKDIRRAAKRDELLPINMTA